MTGVCCCRKVIQVYPLVQLGTYLKNCQLWGLRYLSHCTLTYHRYHTLIHEKRYHRVALTLVPYS
ncbi:ORF75 [White spot syndrome virus]|uniref:ORF75 n=1 Tax=White spot syndrome virus TaxID=342409 RepID=A0A2D3I6S6_9VIRU|nr:ORF75 [White spot syndrome virus]